VYDETVPQQVRRAILARIGKGDHNGVIRTPTVTYEWQG
jgi:hypothetical protein